MTRISVKKLLNDLSPTQRAYLLKIHRTWANRLALRGRTHTAQSLERVGLAEVVVAEDGLYAEKGGPGRFVRLTQQGKDVAAQFKRELR